MFEQLYDLLTSNGINGTLASISGYAVVVLVILGLSVLANSVARKILDYYTHKIADKTPTQMDDLMIEHRVVHALAKLGPVLVIYWLSPQLNFYTEIMREIAICVIIVLVTVAIFRALDALVEASRRKNRAGNGPIKGIIQVIKIALSVLTILLILVSFLGDDTAWAIFSGVGGLSAVLLLVFRDSILGLVAGVQLSTGNLLKLGDWLEMAQYGADGEVVDITLTKIVVKNWDKTYTTIPAYKFLEDSFRNWEGMTESGGRRIKRSIAIDMNTIGFLTEDQVETLEGISVLKPYLQKKKEAISAYNQQVDDAHMANLRQLTNIGTFRAYIEAYLRNSPFIHQGLTLLVRQLDSSEKGVPIEIYCFTEGTAWDAYEGIQSDLFDHFFAIMPMFDLAPYQQPSGKDFQSITSKSLQKNERWSMQ